MIFQLFDIQFDVLFQFWGIGLILGFLYYLIKFLPKINKDKIDLRETTARIDKESGLPIQRSKKVKKLLKFRLKTYLLIQCFNCCIISILAVLFFIFIFTKSDSPHQLFLNIINVLVWLYVAINIFGSFIFIRIIIYYIQISDILTETNK